MASDRTAPLLPVDPEIEREFNLRQRHPEREAVYRRFSAASARLRRRAPYRADQRYAPGPRCLLDVFPAQDGTGHAPLLVFIHGGYWRALEKDIFSFVAESYTRSGVSVALVGYDLAPTVTLTEIVDELERAMQWLSASADPLGIRREGVVLSGHSAGAHLCGVLASRTPEQLGGLAVTGVAGLSGVYDLLPLLRASLNRDVRMTSEEAARLSPQGFPAFAAQRFLLAVGSLETDGFQQQSRRFSEHLSSLGCPVELQFVPDRTHFDILDDFADPARTLFASVLELTQQP